MTNGNKKDVDSPLSYAQITEFFDRSAKGGIPKDLQAMLIPEVKPYKFKGLEGQKKQPCQ